jgi:hypothetical protein
MKFTPIELEYLSAWAREAWEADCYQRPAHQLQLRHRVPGGQLIDLIKAWTETEGKRDQAILDAASNPNPTWPWTSEEEFLARLCEAEGFGKTRVSRAGN